MPRSKPQSEIKPGAADPNQDAVAASGGKKGAIVAAKNFLSAGIAAVGLPSARAVWMKMYGACPATGSPGNARIAGGRTVSGINRSGFAACSYGLYDK